MKTTKTTNFELIEIIEQQGELIKELSGTIAQLLLQNEEQESIIEELIQNERPA